MANDYPRPDFLRKSLTWASLNGSWSFLFDDANSGLTEQWQRSVLPSQTEKHQKRTITVPYAFQTPASGINLQEAHEYIWYEREVADIRSEADKNSGNRLLLRFGAVDYECTVWVDGEEYATHRGGYVPFDVDITKAMPHEAGGKDTARVTLRIRDSPTDLTQPRGKQYWGPVPESIFYTPTSGIWQDVWLEVVPGLRIADASGGTVLRSNDIDGGKVTGTVALSDKVDTGKHTVRVITSLIGKEVGNIVAKAEVVVAEGKDSAEFEANVRVAKTNISCESYDESLWHNGVLLWSPEHPNLYEVTLQLLGPNSDVVDEVQTAVGMRSISWENGDGTFRLNGKPYFQTLCLDQGYWPETGLTPPSGEALKVDIELSKKVGLNGCRKHQKVEDPRFLYWADRLGYLVWGEIGNAYEFSDQYIDRFNDEWSQVVKRDRNHPCIVVWTPVNESWAYKNLKDNAKERGHVRSLYQITKSLDQTRPVNDNCGWEHIQTDLTTYHDYSDSAELAQICSKMEGGILARKLNGEMFVDQIPNDPGSSHKPGAPVICSEFGGVNIAPAKDVEAGERDWGYTTAADPNDLLARLEKLFMAVVKGGHTCGFVYTQLTDIEQEVNGLYAYDRKEKVPAAKVKALMDAARDYYYQNIAPKA
ncbi:glycoside hydrolase family 2 protein [Aspergillus undulatus]|uniref:glycoside hydrolase family 2 protein n=1 Tax=Aspergillus undulatus TaxID=1810928 RepID=UPI003CCCC89F